MKTLIIVLVTLLFIPFINSCEDNDEDEITFYDTYIEGNIKDYHTGEPVAGVVFDAHYFVDYTGGGWLGTDPFFAKNVAVSDTNGYYRIRVPKAWKPKGETKFNDIIMIRIYPRDVEGYSFSDPEYIPPYLFPYKDYSYAEYEFKTKSVRTDISPITYGYLKVILPKTSSQGWWSFGNYPEIYETPYYRPQLAIYDNYNDSLNYYLFKVPVAIGSIKIGNDMWTQRGFTIEYPRDTATLNVDME